MKGYGVIKINETGWLEKDIPEIGPFDALLKPIAVAPCTSDVHLAEGSGADITGRIIGHESVGIVVEVGDLVKNFKPGDRVVVPCDTPDWNELGVQTKGNNAHDNGTIMSSFKFLLQKDGVFAEYYSVNNADANLVLLPDDVSVEAALMTTDMMSTGIYGAEMAGIQVGDSVVVFGIGPVGLMAVAGARLLGAGRIYAIGTRKNCADLALEYGATDIISYKDGNTVDQILEKEGGQVDRAIVAGGSPRSMNEALQLVKPNGGIGNIIAYDARDQFDIPALDWGLGMGDVTIRGGFCPGGALRMKKMLNLIQTGRVDPSKLINYRFEGFDKIEDAFKVMAEKPRDLIKPAVFIPENED